MRLRLPSPGYIQLIEPIKELKTYIHTFLAGTLEPTVRQRRPEGPGPAGEDADLQPAQADPRRGGPCTPILRAGTVTPSDFFYQSLNDGPAPPGPGLLPFSAVTQELFSNCFYIGLE